MRSYGKTYNTFRKLYNIKVVKIYEIYAVAV